MLRVTIELIPGGDENRRRELARMHIANLSNLAVMSDYTIYANEGVNPHARTVAWEIRGMISRHDREQSVWALVAKAAAWAADNQP
jgi:hypothetical protein